VKDENTPLHQRILDLRWLAPITVLLLAALHQIVVHEVTDRLAPNWHSQIELIVYGLTGSVVAWIGLTWLAQAVARQTQAEADLRRAYTELEHTHRQLLAVHDIGRQIASAADVQEILELAAQAPVQLTGALGSSVVSFDQARDRLKLDMTWGLSEAYNKALRRRVEAGIPAERCRTCVPLHAQAKSDCPLFQDLQAAAQAEGIASLICLPIAREQGREGIISAYFPSPDGPSTEQVQFLNIVATEIAAALEGVRLRARQMATIYAVERIAQRRQDLDTLIERVLETALTGWKAEAGAVFLYEPEGGTWHSRAWRGLGADPTDPRYGLAVSLAERARQEGHPVILPEIPTDEWRPLAGEGLASVAATPLLAEGEALGVLFLASTRPRVFQVRHAPFLEALAHQAALAVRNAQLHLQLGHMAVLEERYRLSREMHDGLAQTLSGLGWRLDHLEMLLGKGQLDALAKELSDARRMVRETYLDVREAIDGLRLAAEHPGGLVSALREYIADFATRSGITVEFTSADNGLSLPPAAELQLLRIVQEALTNVRKHSGARRAWVRLAQSNGQLELVLADDGRGFDPALPRDRHHLGLVSMRERAESLGGTFTLATGPNQGVRITVVVPNPKGTRENAESPRVPPSSPGFPSPRQL